ncbi:MAG: hypothetical protein IPL86_15815 [Flavobacteriales bacterium]|nr:hypothetical protein [Flavobacteriales bacterium]
MWSVHPRNLKTQRASRMTAKIPLGSLANKGCGAHATVHTRCSIRFGARENEARQEACSWLRETLGDIKEACHIGRFDVELCNRTIDAVAALKKESEMIADASPPIIPLQNLNLR